MEAENLPNVVIDTFEYYYKSLINKETGLLPEVNIENISTLPEYNRIDSDCFEFGKSLSHQAITIKLNGGLGTSMGLSEAKSLLKIKGNYSFLDIIAQQAVKSKIPLLLMNSYNTQEKSNEIIKKYDLPNKNIPIDFLQHKIPKINNDDFKPAEYSSNPILEWCPPGHGEIYTALVTSGILEKLVSLGIKYAFISNSDNLGAVIDYKILGYFAKNDFPFLMEVASRTESDKKGGHLAKLTNGRLVLRESAQCPKDDTEHFQNIDKHKYFNTNTIWLNLISLQKVLQEKNNILELPMIVNKKNVNPQDPNTKEVIQLETAMGSAISVFPGAAAVVVPRTRFAPVKTTEDLLAIRSDNYILDEDYKVLLNPRRNLNPLVINLDKKFYKLVDDLDSRIPEPPSLLDCNTLTIKGNVKLGRNVKLIGNVNLSNDSNEIKIIEDNSIINGK
jgi:UTP--glucose-1-phosphate uridylyltransferase